MKYKVIAKFISPANARSFAFRASETTGRSRPITMGDDQLFWVVTMADGEKLVYAGYEELKY
jgi:hypothetical protein